MTWIVLRTSDLLLSCLSLVPVLWSLGPCQLSHYLDGSDFVLRRALDHLCFPLLIFSELIVQVGWPHLQHFSSTLLLLRLQGHHLDNNPHFYNSLCSWFRIQVQCLFWQGGTSIIVQVGLCPSFLIEILFTTLSQEWDYAEGTWRRHGSSLPVTGVLQDALCIFKLPTCLPCFCVVLIMSLFGIPHYCWKGTEMATEPYPSCSYAQDLVGALGTERETQGTFNRHCY